METNVFEAGTQNFNLPHDVVSLPSGGLFYKSKKKSIKIGYLTANDENTLLGSLNMGNDSIVMSLLRNKMYERDLRPEELIDGDIEAILIFLRNTSFGPEYKLTLTDPQTNKTFDHSVILDELNIKQTEYKPDEDGLFTTILPKTGSTVKLKLLSFGDNIRISKMAEQYPAGRIAPTITWRLMEQIVEVNGNTSKETISEFVNSLPIMDSKYIRNFLRENAPALDLTQRVKAPSGEMVNFDITFGVEFFRPFF
jgi:hypothetical protein